MHIKNNKTHAKTHAVGSARWKQFEHMLLGAYLTFKAFLLYAYWGRWVGFDSTSHIEVVENITWKHHALNPEQFFYGYHPPLGFLLAKLPFSLGFDTATSIAIISWLATLVAFLFLRGIVHTLGQLREPAGIAFLYATASLPLVIFLTRSINLDAIILACCTATLYFSLRIFWPEERTKYEWKYQNIIGLVAAMAAAMFTKYSGVILLCIPVLFFMFSRTWHIPTFLKRGAMSIAVAIALVAPHYYSQYWQPHGSVFLHNQDFFAKDMMEGAKSHRDEHLREFFGNMFKRAPEQKDDVFIRDQGTIRLFDTWRDIWTRERFFGTPPEPTRSIAAGYVYASPLILFLGFIGWIRFAMKHGWRRRWVRLGYVLGSIFLLHWLALLYFIYKSPVSLIYPGKAIYISPIVLFVGYLLAGNIHYAMNWRPFWKKTWYAIWMCLLVLFVVFNHMSSIA